MDIFFITGNKHKAEEVQSLIPAMQQLDIDLPEIQSLDPKEIIEAKLVEAQKHHEGAIAVEDVSLSLSCLNGLPGTMIKWFLQTFGPQGLYELTKKLGDDRATIQCSVGIAQPKRDLVFFSTQRTGRIVAPRQPSTFGWNPIFLQDGINKTYAEMTLEERNAISHRAGAWKQVKEYLAHQPKSKKVRRK